MKVITKGMGALTAALAVSTAAQAQGAADAAPTAAGPASAISPASLEEVVITAQRRAERLQDVPIAVAAVTADQLEASGVRSTLDLAVTTPGLQMNESAGFLLPSLRGVGTQATGPGIENPVAIYIDGVYLASQTASVLTLNNVERVEVLKGPQGTLFGRNSTGGVIQVITRKPSHTFGGSLGVSYGNYGTLSGNVYLTGGLTDNLAIDFAGSVLTQAEGYGVNIVTGKDFNRADIDMAYRTKLLFEPSDRTSIEVAADYFKNKGSSASFRPGVLPNGLNPSAPVPTGDYNGSQDVNPIRLSEGGGASLKIRQDLGDAASFVSITAYRASKLRYDIDYDFSAAPMLASGATTNDRQFSQELQLLSQGEGKLKWIVGAFYFDGEGNNDPKSNRAGFPLTPGPSDVLDQRTYPEITTKSYAAFGQLSYALASGTNVTAGLRYTDEERNLTATSLNLFNGSELPPSFAPVNQSASASKLTWRLSVDQKFGDDIMAYASYNRGFKSGGFSADTPTLPSFRPEQLDAYEVGLKTQLFDRRLRFNASAFYYDYKNIQISTYDLGSLILLNGAAARIYGLEFDFEARPTAGLILAGGLTALDPEFTDFPNAPFFKGCAAGEPLPCPRSAAGLTLPQQSKLTGNMSATYERPLSFATLTLNASYYYNSGFFVDAGHTDKQESYEMVGASIGLLFDDGRYALRAWGRNLTDSHVIRQEAFAAVGSAVSYGAPRTYGLTVEARF